MGVCQYVFRRAHPTRFALICTSENQVTPFTLTTPDQESIYAWHILPLPLYYKNEEKLAAQQSGLSEDITTTEAFQMLKNDPDAKLVISCKYLSVCESFSLLTFFLVHGV